MDRQQLLFVSGSYPASKEGIADAAKALADAIVEKVGADSVTLLTTNAPIITDKIDSNASMPDVEYMDNWRITPGNIRHFKEILASKKIKVVHMDYPGDLYGKTFFASFLPFFVHVITHRKVKCYVRLHEFTNARLLRKIAIIPILLSADGIYVPAKKDRTVVSKFAGKKVHHTYIGSNINVVSTDIPNEEKITVSYFGSVYHGKGIEQMLEMWKKIKEKDIDNKYRFKIIGDIGTEATNHFVDYHKQVWNWIEQYGLKDSIEVTGFVSDKEVSEQIRNTQVATVLYGDGLTLRRGSFLAFLSHGIPIVTSLGDEEANEIFAGHNGVSMTDTSADAIEAIEKYSNLSMSERIEIRDDNIKLSELFDWNEIAAKYLKDYGLINE